MNVCGYVRVSSDVPQEPELSFEECKENLEECKENLEECKDKLHGHIFRRATTGYPAQLD